MIGPKVGRRLALGALMTGFLGACNKVAASGPGSSLLGAVERWNEAAHRLIASRSALAPTFERSDISPDFRGNGNVRPDAFDYAMQEASGFAGWRVAVSGLVERPLSLGLDQIRAMPQRSQITRHDCVEGWSAIGEWTGPQLGPILRMAGLKPEAKFIVFRCADSFGETPYYESIDLLDAFHPQTILAHSLNGEPLPVKNGAPLRMRIERQLGYKQAKYVTGIEAVASLAGIGGGKGGYWEDSAGYQWYAGI